MALRISGLFLCVVIGACAHVPAPVRPPDFELFHAAGCECPNYRVRLWKEGIVEFTGLSHVAQRGTTTRAIDGVALETIESLWWPDPPNAEVTSPFVRAHLSVGCGLDTPSVTVAMARGEMVRGSCVEANSVRERLGQPLRRLDLEPLARPRAEQKSR